MYKLNSLKVSSLRSFAKEQQIEFNTNITAIYGANASGKSNISHSLGFMIWFIKHSSSANISKIPFEPFLLRKDNISPTSLEIEFLSNNKTLRYGFSFKSDKIISEKLVDLSSQKEKIIFSRTEQKIENDSTAKKYGFTKSLLEKTRLTTLLITKAREDNNQYANIVFDFIEKMGVFSPNNPELRETSLRILRERPELKEKVLEFLRSADLWIRDFTIDEIDTPDEVIKNLPLIDELKKQFRKSTLITTKHSVRGDKNEIVDYIQFSLDAQESTGTRIIFDLAPLIVASVEDGSPLYIDEFGIHLHPDICNYILKYFKNNQSQLIINTHDTSLMNELSREEIILVEKNQAEESFVSRLSDYSPRKDAPIEKHYRKGLYGARPFLKEIK